MPQPAQCDEREWAAAVAEAAGGQLEWLGRVVLPVHATTGSAAETALRVLRGPASACMDEVGRGLQLQGQGEVPAELLHSTWPGHGCRHTAVSHWLTDCKWVPLLACAVVCFHRVLWNVGRSQRHRAKRP